MEILYKNYFLHFVSLLLSMEGKSPGRYSYAPTLPGPKQTLTHYRQFHILVNDGLWVGFSKEVCSSTIYACISLSIFMSSKLFCDN